MITTKIEVKHKIGFRGELNQSGEVKESLRVQIKLDEI